MLLPMLVLPTPGGPTRQMMLPLTPPVQLADADEFEDPLLDVFKAVMIVLKNFFRFGKFMAFIAVDSPRNDRQPIKISSGDSIFCGLHFQSSQLFHFILMTFWTSGGTLRSLMRASNFSLSSDLSSFSIPSSFLMVLSCSRKKKSFWLLEMVASIF